jgi:3-hydroxyacyl-CoA dehydrogenase
MSTIKRVAVIGAGTMGHSLAQVFAQGGYTVWLADIDDVVLSKARRMIASNLETLVETGCFPEAEVPAAISRIHTTTRAEEAGQDADFVIEAIVEDIPAKNSFALRTPTLGLVKRFDFAGLDLTQKILRNRQYDPPAIIDRSAQVDRLVAQGKLGAKTGCGFFDYGNRTTEEITKERDVKLIQLREYLRELGEL